MSHPNSKSEPAWPPIPFSCRTPLIVTALILFVAVAFCILLHRGWTPALAAAGLCELCCDPSA